MNHEPLVSVIVPTRNSASTLEACLRSIRAQMYERIELIVVDRDSTDDTRKIADAMGARVLTAHPERSAQRNAGARAAAGRWLLFVDSDMTLEPQVVTDCVAATRIEGNPPALVIPERGFDDTLLARARSLEKRCYVGNEAVEAARFYPRQRFLELGGFDESLHAAEDWDLTDRWRAAESPVGRIDSFIIHDDRTLTIRALLRKRVFYGRQFVSFVRKHERSALKHLKPSRFLRRPQLLVREPLAAMVLIALKVAETVAFGAGALLGWLQRGEDPLFGRTRRASEALATIPGARVLDLGCSSGWLARQHPDRSIIATDIHRADGALPSGPFASADARRLPFADGSFDVVCFFDVLEHLPSGTEMAALQDIKRVLRPGGTLLLSTPNRHVLGCLLDPAWWLRGHRHYRVEAVQAMLAAAGFQQLGLSIHGGTREAVYLPLFYLFRRARLRMPREGRWRSAIDTEYQRPGWYTIFATAQRSETEHTPAELVHTRTAPRSA